MNIASNATGEAEKLSALRKADFFEDRRARADVAAALAQHHYITRRN